MHDIVILFYNLNEEMMLIYTKNVYTEHDSKMLVSLVLPALSVGSSSFFYNYGQTQQQFVKVRERLWSWVNTWLNTDRQHWLEAQDTILFLTSSQHNDLLLTFNHTAFEAQIQPQVGVRMWTLVFRVKVLHFVRPPCKLTTFLQLACSS